MTWLGLGTRQAAALSQGRGWFSGAAGGCPARNVASVRGLGRGALGDSRVAGSRWLGWRSRINRGPTCWGVAAWEPDGSLPVADFVLGHRPRGQSSPREGQGGGPEAGCFLRLVLSWVQRRIRRTGPASSGVDAGPKLESGARAGRAVGSPGLQRLGGAPARVGSCSLCRPHPDSWLCRLAGACSGGQAASWGQFLL